MESNDPVRPKVILSVSAQIDIQFGFETQILDFGRLLKGETATKTAIVTLKDHTKRNLLEVTSKSPYIGAEIIESTTTDADRIDIEVTVKEGAPPGKFNESITVRLSDNSYRRSSLALKGVIIGNIEATPESIRLTADTSRSVENQIEQSIRVVPTNNDFTFDIFGVSDPRDQVSLEVDTIALGEHYTIRVRPNEKALEMGRNLAGEVKVLTSDSEQPEFIIRYSIIFPKR